MTTEFAAHRLLVEAHAETSILLGEHQGSALRGALFRALKGRPNQPGFCLAPARTECRGCPTLAGCPVSFLLATVDEDGRRGADVPRPYVIDPPLGHHGHYAPGEPLSFAVTMFARALNLLPYVVIATRRLEEQGVGRAYPNDRRVWRPGRFRVDRLVATNPLSGETQLVLARGADLVSVPAVPATHEQVERRARALAPGRLAICFLTPTRLVAGGHTVRQPVFSVLVQRLIERLSSLWEEYSSGPLPIAFAELMETAGRVRLIRDETRWVELRGYSTRQSAPKFLDGFVGRAVYEGELGPLLPWLVWGEITHVGKDAVKGCGMYMLEGEE